MQSSNCVTDWNIFKYAETFYILLFAISQCELAFGIFKILLKFLKQNKQNQPTKFKTTMRQWTLTTCNLESVFHTVLFFISVNRQVCRRYIIPLPTFFFLWTRWIIQLKISSLRGRSTWNLLPFFPSWEKIH